jgi:RNA-binding protein 8A
LPHSDTLAVVRSPITAVEGFLILVSGLHEETNEDDLYELFADHGEIKQLHLNLDRRTGFVKGYALLEYASFKEAQAAIQALNGHQLHEKPLTVDWALRPTATKKGGNRRGGGGGQRYGGGGGGGGGFRGQRDSQPAAAASGGSYSSAGGRGAVSTS